MANHAITSLLDLNPIPPNLIESESFKLSYLFTLLDTPEIKPSSRQISEEEIEQFPPKLCKGCDSFKELVSFVKRSTLIPSASNWSLSALSPVTK